VEKFIGDAVMALFGAPTAHEDDPERAVRAALAIRDWATEEGDLQVRIGVTTGEALVALGARPEAGEGMASGDVVNTAARLQAAASTNGILVDETTYRATSRTIEYREPQFVEAKGKAEPIPVWEPFEARARFGVDVVRRPRTPFIGREKELDVLVDALRRAREEREPQLVTLVGVPGIGKSRLVSELFQTVEQDPDLIYWRQGRSLPYGEVVSFWALAEMVKAQAGILETDSAEQAAEKLRSSVADTVDDPADANWVERHLRPLVGLAAESELGVDRTSEAFSAWRRFFEGLAEHGPIVLVFEDLHWADEGLLDFVDHLVDWASGVPILVVGTSRPELLAKHPAWAGGKPNATTLSLAALSEDDTARLVSTLLQRPVLPADLQATLLARAGGNPLYAEEFARIVEERGLMSAAGELPLPESVQGIIGARLDALPAEEKALLQDAAVVGKVFWLGALSALGGLERRSLEERLHALERREFVRRERRSAVEGETQYAFLHLLIRDVAYGQIPRARRAEKHELAARWIESLSPDRSEDRAEMLSHHYLLSLDLARAAGHDIRSLVDPARSALAEAGDRAFALNAFSAAVRFYERAVELSAPDDPDRPHLLLRYGTSQRIAEEAGEETLLEARDALLASGDREAAAEAEIVLSQLAWDRGLGDLASEHLDRAAALTHDATTSHSKARVLSFVSRARMLANRTEEAIDTGREALAMAEELGLDELRAHALNNIGSARTFAGDFGGIADLEQSLEISLALNSPESARAYNNLGAVYESIGDLRRSFELRRQAVATARRFGDAAMERFLRSMDSWEAYESGDWDEASRLADEFLSEVEGGMPHVQEFVPRWVRGQVRLGRGDTSGALDDARRGVDSGRLAKDPQTVLPALACYAWVLVEAGQVSDARVVADECMEIADAGYQVNFEWLHLSFVLDRLGRREDLEAALRDALPSRWADAAKQYVAGELADAADVYAEIGTMPGEAITRLHAAERLISEGRRSEADEQLQKALTFYRTVGAARYIQEGEALLAASA
jgi:predicted ATPase